MFNNNYTYLHPNSGYPVKCKLLDIYDLLEHKEAVLLPIRAGSKAPAPSCWQRIQHKETQANGYLAQLEQSFKNSAVGVKLGDVLHAIDIDTDELADQFLELNPRLQKTLRTRGKRGCQLWLKINGDVPDSCKLKLSGRPIGEWRSKGNQSIIYGQHPDGPRYQVLTQEKPVTIEFEEINWPKHWTANFIKFKEPKKDTKLDRRITEYVTAIPGAVSGDGGHDQTYAVACALTHGFALSEAEAPSIPESIQRVL